MDEPDTAAITWEFRRRTLAATQALLRILHSAVEVYGDDLEATVIYLAVTCASIGGALSHPDRAVNPPPPGRLPRVFYRTVSRRAIAASTGLPRETVRRKIAAFLARGDLVAEGARVRIPVGLLENPRHFAFAQVLIAEFERTGRTAAQIAAQSRREL